MNGTVDTKRIRLASRGEIDVSDALGRFRIAGDRIEEPHIQFAHGPDLPARMAEIVHISGDFERAVLDPRTMGREPQAAKKKPCPLEIDRGLQRSVDRH
jgi:hypothetical protein